ncbi:hypothetical protein C8Q77DRAFT_320554 [Trametes polyzona]|nr:hypothetical protein C8Q77DRAFT_320554 [Trametes polyzona]
MSEMSDTSNTSNTPTQVENGKHVVKTEKASEPFDREDADLVLRSSNNVDFHVHSLILTLASPVFANMFTFPQPPGTDTTRPVVDVVESSTTLDVFLRVLYPLPDPEVHDLSTVRLILDAATKYDAPAVITVMKRALTHARALGDNPLRVFAIACYYGMEEETKAAAETAVVANRVAGRICAELNDIAAGPYYRLLQLDRTRKRVKSKSSGINRVTVDFTGIGPFCEPPKSAKRAQRMPTKAVGAPFDSPEADLVLRSCDSVDFRVSRTLISLASPSMLQRVLRDTVEGESVAGSVNPITVCAVPEDSVVVDALLRICYPTEHPDLKDPDLFLDVLAAGRKYEIGKVERVVRDGWCARALSAPLPLYLAAAKYGWESEARICADELVRRFTVSSIETIYHPDLETTSNRWYHYLLHYVGELSKAATSSHTLTLQASPTTGEYTPPCCAAGLSSSCRTLLPSSVISTEGPTWLKSSLKDLADALRERPLGSTLAMYGAEAQKFLVAVAKNKPPCSPGSFGGKSCTTADAISWGCMLLQQYAKEVDNAVTQVGTWCITQCPPIVQESMWWYASFTGGTLQVPFKLPDMAPSTKRR